MKDIYQRGLADRILEVYGAEGSGAVVKKVARRLRHALCRRNAALWFGRDLTSPLPATRAEVPGSFSPIEPRELARWLWETENLAWAADPRELEIALRCEHNWTCWRLCGEIAAFCKVGHGRAFVVDFDRAVSLPDGVALVCDVYVLAQMRRKGIAQQLLVATMNLLKENSFTVLGCHIPVGNEPSVNLFSSLGFQSFGEVRFTRVLGLPVFSTRPETILERMTM